MEPTRRRWGTTRRVDLLRKQITVPFLIRGHVQEQSFVTRKKIKLTGGSIPVYFIAPKFDISSKEWVRRLRATIHAAVARGSYGILGYEHGKEKGRLPAITVLVSSLGVTSLKKSGKKEFLGRRRLTLRLDPKGRIRQSFPPHGEKSEMYDWASVSGQKKPTFPESVISGGRIKNDFWPSDKKLFEVKLTPKEYALAIKKTDERLWTWGYTTQTLYSEYKGSQGTFNEGKRGDLWGIAVSASGHKEWWHTRETTSGNPAEYLLYQEIARIMTNKFLRRGLKWLQAILGKEGVKLAIRPKH